MLLILTPLVLIPNFADVFYMEKHPCVGFLVIAVQVLELGVVTTNIKIGRKQCLL